MPRSLNQKMATAVSFFWHVCFRQPPPDGLQHHLDRHVGFGVGMMAAKLLSVGAQVLIGRVLGEAAYGELTIVLLLASYFALPIAGGWGLAFARIASVEKDAGRRAAALKALWLISAVAGVVVTGCLLALRRELADWLHLEKALIDTTIVMTLLYAWWALSRQIAQAFERWRVYVAIEMSLAGVLLGAAILLAGLGRADLFSISAAFWVAYGAGGSWSLRWIRTGGRWGAVPTPVKAILRHGIYLLLSALVTVSTYSIDRIILYNMLGAAQVGLYQAHFLSTFGVISSLMTILFAYLFPLFCRDEAGSMRTALGKLSRLQYPATIALCAGVGRGVLWLYDFPVSVPLFVYLSLFGGVQFHVQIKAWYLSGKGADASRTVLVSQLIFLAANVVALLLLVGRLGVEAGGLALLLAAGLSLLFLICVDRAP